MTLFQRSTNDLISHPEKYPITIQNVSYLHEIYIKAGNQFFKDKFFLLDLRKKFYSNIAIYL